MKPIPHLGDPNNQSLREYIVTLKDMSDSEEFYNDMETEGGNLYIPNRQVECINRRPISRNTHYSLTYNEAVEIRKDPRVLTVELNPVDLKLTKGRYGFEQTSTHFDKRTASDPLDINWGFLRCLAKTNISNWGINGYPEEATTIFSDCSGKNVDVVIMDDGCPYPTVYEYAQNSDGTGYSRMVEYNWYQHNPVVSMSPPGNFDYAANRLQEHGGHTTGTVAGNTQGWARDANIYNITYDQYIDYVREFHKNKPINPKTGVKNPTVMNNSWGYRAGGITLQMIDTFVYRGVEYNRPAEGWTQEDADFFRFRNGASVPVRVESVDQDMIDAMNEGVIVVASAGNSYWYCDNPEGPDYDNLLSFTFFGDLYTFYYHRGSSPGSANGGTDATRVICVGAMGQHNEGPSDSLYLATGIESGDHKSEFSNYGPRIDVYAPGSAIQSVWKSGSSLYDNFSATDPRVAALGGTDIINNNFKKCPGTSMSGPQVTGVLACLAEKYPRMTQAQAHSYIKTMCLPSLESTAGGTFDSKDAGVEYNSNSNTRVLLLSGTRVSTDYFGTYNTVLYPENTAASRPSSGQLIPRRRTFYSAKNKSVFNITSNVSSVVNGGVANITVTATNVPNGTKVPYIISSHPTPGYITQFVEDGVSGVFSTDTRVEGTENFSSIPDSGNRITTINSTQGTCTPITNSILGPVALTGVTPDSPGDLVYLGSTTGDDGYFEVPLPFLVDFLGISYDRVYVGTNSYITFGAGSDHFAGLGRDDPALPKIMISANDNSCQRIWYGIEGSGPNKSFRIRYEGHKNYSGGTLGSPTMVYEAVFYEGTPNQIDIQTGINERWQELTDYYAYPFDNSMISQPLAGTVTINNGTASLPITFNTTVSMQLNVRLGIFPAPNVNINVN